tara:strand:- start:136 stop:687 length:552 start_codon:yes stop_codon:yes gene_type:complete
MEIIIAITLIAFIFWVRERNKKIDKDFNEELKKNSSSKKEINKIKNDDIKSSDIYEIIGDFGDLMTETSREYDSFFDVSILPHPKKIIKESLISAIKKSNDKEITAQLKVGLLQLTQFQENIGPKPIINGITSLLINNSLEPEELARKMDAIENEDNSKYYDSLRVIADREYKFYESLLGDNI